MSLLGKILCWLIPDFKLAARAARDAQAAINQVKFLQNQMSAAQAIDMSLRGTGKIILMTRIQGRDKVKILDCKPEMTVLEYKALVDALIREYGAQVGWADMPIHVKDDVIVRG